MPRPKLNRTNEKAYNKFGSLMIISNYRGANDIDVYFPEYNWTFYNTIYKDFKNGHIKCPYEPRFSGVGYIGEGKYKMCENGIETQSSIIWCSMLQRCYNSNNLLKCSTYNDCYVCDEWLNYQNFAKWYNDNYYTVNDEIMCLDKDILYKGNRIYGPDTCIFVPTKINNLFTKCNKSRGGYPIGVSFYNNKYIATCSNGYGNNKKLGRYNTIEEAFNVYKEYKEYIIKQIAEEYKEFIPFILYEALCSYEVDITD